MLDALCPDQGLGVPFILKQPPLFYQSLPFYGKNLSPLFWENFKNQPRPL